MKTKLTIAAALAIAAFSSTNAQNTFPNNGNVGVGTLAPATTLQVIGTSRFGAAANYAQFDGSGNLNFTGAGNYRVGGNRYAFQFSGNPNYGLFFNSTNTRYEFRDGGALPVFYIGANDGNSVFTGGVRVGNSTLTNAGNIRWTGADFQGYNGASWVSFTATGGGSGWGLNGNSGTTAATNFIGTTDNAGFVIRTNSSERLRVTSDGRVGIGTSTPDARLHVFGGTDANLTGGGYIVSGDINGLSVVIDDNEIMARNAVALGDSSTLYLNNSGGTVRTGGSMRIPQELTFEGDGKGVYFANGQFIKDFPGAGSTFIQVHGDLVPDNTSTHSLGSSTLEWTDIWAIDGSVNKVSTKTTKNVNDLNYGLKEILKLRPVSYNRINNPEGGDGMKRLGILADEIKEIIPEVVKDWKYSEDLATKKISKVSIDDLGISLENIIPVLVKGMQEQQKMIEDQKKQIEELVALVKNQKAVTNNSSDLINTKNIAKTALLEQNTPNPFNSVTTIRYNISAAVSKAQITVTNATGNTVKSFTLSNKGAGSVTINANELTAGSYYYTLIVDGKKADSKQMVLIK